MSADLTQVSVHDTYLLQSGDHWLSSMWQIGCKWTSSMHEMFSFEIWWSEGVENQYLFYMIFFICCVNIAGKIEAWSCQHNRVLVVASWSIKRHVSVYAIASQFADISLLTSHGHPQIIFHNLEMNDVEMVALLISSRSGITPWWCLLGLWWIVLDWKIRRMSKEQAGMTSSHKVKMRSSIRAPLSAFGHNYVLRIQFL